MTRPCHALVTLALVGGFSSMIVAAPPRAAVSRPLSAAAEESSGTAARPAAGEPRIRTTDRRVRALMRQGLGVSPTLRRLVERIERSDVVVYVECERYAKSRAAGRLTFVSSAGGLRYVVVRLMRLDSRAQQIALLAHELQHAAEIADTPAIVDGPSLAREYQRFGHVNASAVSSGHLAFDTTAAIEMGRRVLEEIIARGE